MKANPVRAASTDGGEGPVDKENGAVEQPKFKRLKKTSSSSQEEDKGEGRRRETLSLSGDARVKDEHKGGLTLSQSPQSKKPKGKKAAPAFGVGEKSIAAAALNKSFDAKGSATWKEGEPVPYSALAETFDKLSGTSKRLEKTKILTEFFRTVVSVTPEDLLPCVYLSVCQIAPSHDGIELGIGDSTIMKALSESTGKTVNALKDEMKKKGDLGDVAMSCRSAQKTMFQPKPLVARHVFQEFKTIALTEGGQSMEKKKSIIKKLLTSSKRTEATYVVRALQGKLRVGASEQTVVAALSRAILWEKDEFDKKSDETIAKCEDEADKIVKQVFSECPSFDLIIPALLASGVFELPKHCKFTVGVPIRPMLAKPTTGVHEVLEKFTDVEFTCEYKYDGERAQIHYQDGKIKIFSRNAEDNTPKYPEVSSEILPKSLRENTRNVVLDGEIVAFDRELKQILPFQRLQKRKRKDVTDEDMKKQAQVCYFAFDCLYYNDKSLLQSTLLERREALREACQEQEGMFLFATDKTSNDVEELQVFLEESIVAKTEGLIVKTVDSTYEPSQRSLNWLKLKKDYMDGVGDSLDLVVVGAWHGKGKRKGVYGNFLLAVYNDDDEVYEVISKIGTGFEEAELAEVHKDLSQHKIDAPRSYYKFKDNKNVPDVWFDAKVVWEVKVANLTLSPHYESAFGMAEAGKGISMRFPRYERTRKDRTPTSATTSTQLLEMYENQPEAGGRGNKNANDYSD